jgi:hypothetical protein
MDFTRLKGPDEYRRQREELRLAELELADHVERVAALRQCLSPGPVIDDYELVDVASGEHIPRCGQCGPTATTQWRRI